MKKYKFNMKRKYIGEFIDTVEILSKSREDAIKELTSEKDILRGGYHSYEAITLTERVDTNNKMIFTHMEQLKRQPVIELYEFNQPFNPIKTINVNCIENGYKLQCPVCKSIQGISIIADRLCSTEANAVYYVTDKDDGLIVSDMDITIVETEDMLNTDYICDNCHTSLKEEEIIIIKN